MQHAVIFASEFSVTSWEWKDVSNFKVHVFLKREFKNKCEGNPRLKSKSILIKTLTKICSRLE